MNFAQIITGKSKHVQALRKRLERLSTSGKSLILVGEEGTGKSRIAAALGATASGLTSLDAARMAEDELRASLDALSGNTLLIEGLEESSFRAQELVSCFLSRRGSSVRIIATLRSAPEDLREKRRLIDDLYGKVLAFERVDMLPLRERPEDIPLLVRELAPGLVIDVNGLEVLVRQLWTGNVRELRNTVESCIAGSQDGAFRLPEVMVQDQQEFGRTLGGVLNGRGAPVESSLDGLEQSLLRHALERCGHDLERVAAMLGMTPPDLNARLVRLGLSRGSSAA
jgi:DNA-binding NtrC family response regulator